MPFTKGQLGNELVFFALTHVFGESSVQMGGGAAVTPCKSAPNATVKESVVDAGNDSGTGAALP